MKLPVRVMLVLTACSMVFVAGCKDAEWERENLRKELDEEFEKETGELVKTSVNLTEMVRALVAEHEELDLLHEQLDSVLADRKLSEADQAAQKRHLVWERQHEGVIDRAEKALEGFRRRASEHEEMERQHGNVPVVKVREEHERFEKDLDAIRKEFTGLKGGLEKARAQMKVIFEEHRKMEERYRQMTR